MEGSAPYDIILSDVGRAEAGHYVRRAGLSLLEGVREAGLLTPVVFFTSTKTASLGEIQELIQKDGRAQITASTAELYTKIERALASNKQA